MTAPTVNLICGDAVTVMRTMKAESVNAIITSVPYLGKRKYDTANDPREIGSETTIQTWLANLTSVFAEAHRVLHRTGTLWINVGDSFANDAKWGGRSGSKNNGAHTEQNEIGRQKRDTGLPPKSLMMLPARLALTLQDAPERWILRSDIVWSKPNPIPDRASDRPSVTHEHIYMFSKQHHYYYDALAVCRNVAPKTITTYGTTRTASERSGPHDTQTKSASVAATVRRGAVGADGEPLGAQLGSVWVIGGRSDATWHPATFPPALALLPITAATSAYGACANCSAQYERQVHTTTKPDTKAGANALRGQGQERDTTGWRKPCRCKTTEVKPPVVLDPFSGAANTGTACQLAHVSYVGIDLSQTYTAKARRRLAQTQFATTPTSKSTPPEPPTQPQLTLEDAA